MSLPGYQSVEDLPRVIPVFPLDGALLLPGAGLPLNIFEPRYLNMIDDAMSGERIIGMIQTVVDRSGAEVAALDLAVKRLAEFTLDNELDDQMAVNLMKRNGVPGEIADKLKELTASFRDWGNPVIVTQPVAAGTWIEMGSRRYEVLHRPGHSPSDNLI